MTVNDQDPYSVDHTDQDPDETAEWQESLDAPAWDGPEVWVHGDLLPGNLLVVEIGRAHV